jgi:hypothetical protein
MNRRWPATLSIIASLVLVISVLWPQQDEDITKRDTAPRISKNDLTEKRLLTASNPVKSKSIQSVQLPPPPILSEKKAQITPKRNKKALTHPPTKIKSSTQAPKIKPLNSNKPHFAEKQRKFTSIIPLESKREDLKRPKPPKAIKLKPLVPANPPEQQVTAHLKKSTPGISRPEIIEFENPEMVPDESISEFNRTELEGPQTSKSIAKGRVLLRILEHGKGPDIAFAWPNSPQARNHLFDVLRKCYGMTLAIMSKNNVLYRLIDPPDKPWELNIDRFSGFIRLIDGEMADAEERLVTRIIRHHPSTRVATPVRVFPRKFDAAVLGALSPFISGDTAPVRSISARYKLNGQKLWIVDIRINRRSVPGRINLAITSKCNKPRRVA